MSRPRRYGLLLATFAATATLLTTTACSVGSIGGNSDASVEITYLVGGNEADEVDTAEKLIDAFEADHPDIAVTMDTRPGGTEGDNIVKTRLSTGEMADVFAYNSGSLFQAINPDTNLVPLDDEPWVKDLVDPFPEQVSTDKGVYGAPLGATSAGGILYNIPLYEELGLEVPTSWDDFMANNEKIKKAGDAAPVIQTYGETYTSQLFVLADFANVAAQDPQWAEEYTKHKRKYAEEPALQGFEHLAEVNKAGMLNEDFASASLDDGARMVATGEGAHYPMLSSLAGTIEQNTPDNVADVGIFPIPAQDAADTRLTVWMPGGLYIPKTTEGDKLEAAKEFIRFAMSDKGCQIMNDTSIPSGPYAISTCELPTDVPQIAKDVQSYYDQDKTGPALEFISPIKGPNLENITVEVGSGIRSPKAGAKLYDQDVEKQAQQLGLPGW